jgi:hypothetical protein
MLYCHIIDLVFAGNSLCSAIINLGMAVSHVSPNSSIYSTPSSFFQEARNLTFCVQAFQTTSA